ncbi:hypothetical protein HNY73_011194 [Argiope bruennichi]|uniref:Uncharacterized protein n=1 Tax=Argiope bruennichi TaxID=94029 RepID=A0A8T0F4B1_ARGBR|nr:hypothetical protein HNY73_011194 [Argiope bruennichi]
MARTGPSQDHSGKGSWDYLPTSSEEEISVDTQPFTVSTEKHLEGIEELLLDDEVDADQPPAQQKRRRVRPFFVTPRENFKGVRCPATGLVPICSQICPYQSSGQVPFPGLAIILQEYQLSGFDVQLVGYHLSSRLQGVEIFLTPSFPKFGSKRRDDPDHPRNKECSQGITGSGLDTSGAPTKKWPVGVKVLNLSWIEKEDTGGP